MMLAWLTMVVITVVCLWYVMGYLTRHAYRANAATATSDFFALRANEVKDEQHAGRLSDAEATQLLDDLAAEARYMDERGQFALNQDVKVARWSLSAMIAVTVVGAVALYQHLGYATDVAFTEKVMAHSATNQDVSDFLSYRVRHYGRAEDWYYLASDQVLSKEYSAAAQSYRTVLGLLESDSTDRVNVQAELAQTLFYANGNKVSEAMRTLVEDVLRQAPNHVKALGLRGIIEFEAGDYKQSILAWQAALRSGADRQQRVDLLSGITAARKQGGITEDEVPSVITHRLQLQLVLGSGAVTADDIFLVYARSLDQPMPIAIQRITSAQFDQPVVLTNIDNLMPGRSLSDVEQVEVVVKRSRQGAKDLTQGEIVGHLSSIPSDSDKIFKVNVSL